MADQSSSQKVTKALATVRVASGADKSDLDAPLSLESLLSRVQRLEKDQVTQRHQQQKAAIATNGELARLHRSMAILLLESRRPKAAIIHCKRTLHLKPRDIGVMRDLADALAMSGQYTEATRAYQHILEQNPDDWEPYELISALYTEMGDIERCQQVLHDMLAKKPYYLRKKGKPGDPVILRLSGLDGTYTILDFDRSGRPYATYRGGHYTTKHLLPSSGYKIFKWTISENNINRRDDIPAHDIIVNTIADADTERASLIALNDYLQARPKVPVINHPARIQETTRDNNARRFNGLDRITFPRTERVLRGGMDRDGLLAHINKLGLKYPLILRETGTHTARTVGLAKNEAEAAGYFDKSAGTEFYFIEYLDERIDGKYFNKKRFFCIDGQLYPVVSHLDKVWNVHGGNRRKVMAKHPWMQEQEKAFLEDPAAAIGAENYKVLAGLHHIVGLDFFGMDFTLRADGTMLIFELNASMRHSNDHSKNFPYMQPHMDRISQAFADMVQKRLKA